MNILYTILAKLLRKPFAGDIFLDEHPLDAIDFLAITIPFYLTI